ncbi:ABC transporter permease [Micrococcoides hystricis]|uniref:ABC transporter permease n=1 Tax=Micrococcoides hystricis TaxID=1572761 RepID=A0ABV6PAP7_9MICC
MSTATRSRSFWQLVLLRSWLPILLLLIWWFGSANSESLYFPSLQEILHTLRVDWLGNGFAQHLLPSLGKFLAGFLIAAALGIGLGLLIGLSRTLMDLTEPIIQFLRSLPPPVLLPIGLLLFGIGPAMNIAIIAFGAMWPTLLNTVDGVRSLDGELREMSRSYRLSFSQRLRFVVLPHASPQIFAGLRTTLQISIILIVVAEMVAATQGVGFYLLNSQQTFEVAETWAGTLLLGGIGYLTTLVFNMVEASILSWHRQRNQLALEAA